MTVELDKLDIHYRQQLSALMDGELSPDEARFLLRRLQHDTELSARWERWQLCGDALRGRTPALAPAGFAASVAAAVADEANQAAVASASQSRGRLARWGGGALAASVALVALFMARQQTPQEDVNGMMPSIASATQPSGDSDRHEDAGTLADAGNASERVLASAATASAEVASMPRRADARRSATRTQQAGRSAAARNATTAVAVAAVAPPVVSMPAMAASPSSLPAMDNATPALATRDPFSRTLTVSLPQSRPWPRSVLSPTTAAGGALTTGYLTDSGVRTFYPFEPSLAPVPQTEPLR